MSYLVTCTDTYHGWHEQLELQPGREAHLHEAGHVAIRAGQLSDFLTHAPLTLEIAKERPLLSGLQHYGRNGAIVVQQLENLALRSAQYAILVSNFLPIWGRLSALRESAYLRRLYMVFSS